MTEERHPPPLPPPRRRILDDDGPGRRNDLLRRSVMAALRTSGRYAVTANARVPITERARAFVRRAGGGFHAASLPLDGSVDTLVVDMLVVDARNRWAGIYVFCRPGAQSYLARRRVENDLRAAELVLRAHLKRTLRVPIETVTAAVVDGSARADRTDDLTLTTGEIADHFEIAFPDADIGSVGSFGGVRA